MVTAQRTGVTTRSSAAHARTTTATEPWMYRYTVTTFDQLHAELYPILHELAMQKINDDSYFCKKWKQFTSRNQLKMTPKMTWKQAQECLGISDLSQYKDFVLQCPKIQDRIKITYNKGAIEMGVIQQEDLEIQTKNKSHQGNLKSTSSVSSISPALYRDTCDETPKKFQSLLKLIILIFYDFIDQHPEDPYSRICQEWFNKGLTDELDPQDVYDVCNISNLEDLYFLLHIALPTKGKIHVQWNQDAIDYEILEQPQDKQSLAGNVEAPRTPMTDSTGYL